MRTPEDHETDADELIRLGAIASVDLAAARCTVEISDGVESGPLKWIEPRMGATRVWSPPTIGEQVLLICPAGEIGAGIVLRGIVSDAFPAPDNRAIDLIKFSDGAVISYDAAAHALSVTLPAGGTVELVADGGTSITGDIAITGNVDVTGTVTASDDVVGGGISLNSHIHGGVQSGGSNTSTPS